jgi:hypothetical protein
VVDFSGSQGMWRDLCEFNRCPEAKLSFSLHVLTWVLFNIRISALCGRDRNRGLVAAFLCAQLVLPSVHNLRAVLTPQDVHHESG